MNVYIAAATTDFEIVREVATALQRAGHVQTFDWTRAEEVNGTQVRADLAEAEVEGVRRADLLVAIMPGGRGTHAEIGAALGLKKPILLVCFGSWALSNSTSRKECLFYSHALVQKLVLTGAEIVNGMDALGAIVAAVQKLAPPAAVSEPRAIEEATSCAT